MITLLSGAIYYALVTPTVATNIFYIIVDVQSVDVQSINQNWRRRTVVYRVAN
jgi:hypothetical protein